jgi:hypothetical protein
MVGTGCALHFSFSMIGEKKSKKNVERGKMGSCQCLGFRVYYVL